MEGVCRRQAWKRLTENVNELARPRPGRCAPRGGREHRRRGDLELHGFRVLHAENGRQGIETLVNNPDVALVLMDVMMPEMDGYTATAEIRRMPQYAELPIIAVTAKAMPGDREKSLASGASDYVTKPVDTRDLIACVRRWLPV
ncbi:Sensor histidine kinase RcsC [Streptomyces violarus]